MKLATQRLRRNRSGSAPARRLVHVAGAVCLPYFDTHEYTSEHTSEHTDNYS